MPSSRSRDSQAHFNSCWRFSAQSPAAEPKSIFSQSRCRISLSQTLGFQPWMTRQVEGMFGHILFDLNLDM